MKTLKTVLKEIEGGIESNEEISKALKSLWKEWRNLAQKLETTLEKTSSDLVEKVSKADLDRFPASSVISQSYTRIGDSLVLSIVVRPKSCSIELHKRKSPDGNILTSAYSITRESSGQAKITKNLSVLDLDDLKDFETFVD